MDFLSPWSLHIALKVAVDKESIWKRAPVINYFSPEKKRDKETETETETDRQKRKKE